MHIDSQIKHTFTKLMHTYTNKQTNAHLITHMCTNMHTHTASITAKNRLKIEVLPY